MLTMFQYILFCSCGWIAQMLITLQKCAEMFLWTMWYLFAAIKTCHAMNSSHLSNLQEISIEMTQKTVCEQCMNSRLFFIFLLFVLPIIATLYCVYIQVCTKHLCDQ